MEDHTFVTHGFEHLKALSIVKSKELDIHAISAIPVLLGRDWLDMFIVRVCLQLWVFIQASCRGEMMRNNDHTLLVMKKGSLILKGADIVHFHANFEVVILGCYGIIGIHGYRYTSLALSEKQQLCIPLA